MKHLTAADYKVMPWANRKGSTTELWRKDRGGAMLLRLSRAAVVEDGPFSRFPGINRNLTVITGPGFDLVGDGVHLFARPLQPVAFSGDLAIRAVDVAGASEDVNVMVSSHMAAPEVSVTDAARWIAAPSGGIICLYALAPLLAAGVRLDATDLIVTDGDLDKGPGRALIVLIRGCADQILNQD